MVRPVGEVDIATVDRLRDVLDEALNGGRDVLVDLCDCLFIDSTGIAQLLRAQRRCDDRGVLMAVACLPSGPCARVLLLAVREWLQLHDTREDGLAALRAKRQEGTRADEVAADPDRHAELSMLSEEQRLSLKGFLERHPACCLEVQEFGKGFFVVRARQSERGSLIMERHIFPSRQTPAAAVQRES